jgi:hypothetical protein
MSVEKNQGGAGPLIASIIIVILLLVGGYYSFKSTNLPPATPSQTTDNQPAPAISIPATPAKESTEIGDIEEDAKAVDLSDIDTGLENLDLLVKE